MITGNKMRSIAEVVKMMLPEGFGFAILVFPFNSAGTASYISNADRETMILALKEKVKVLEEKKDFGSIEEN